jgi:hypothetical protein
MACGGSAKCIIVFVLLSSNFSFYIVVCLVSACEEGGSDGGREICYTILCYAILGVWCR